MRKIFTLFSLALFTISSTSAQSNAGLVAHWPLNGNVNDSTAKGHNGTAHNITADTGITGQPNTAYYFDGISSYVATPYKADLNVTKYSLCAIIKPMGYYGGDCQTNDIICRGSEGNLGSFILKYYDNAYDGDCLLKDTSKNVFAPVAGTATATGNAANFKYTPTIVSNTWYTVVSTFDGSTFKTYVDGTLKSTYPTTGGAIGTSTQPLNLGSTLANTGAYPYWLNAVLDDARVYNRVLDDSEIKQYAAKIYVNSTDTVCQGTLYNVNVKLINGSFIQTTGTVYTVELSDITGSFVTPLVIGTYTVGSSGTINALTIPCVISVPAGAYKLRVRTTTLDMYSDASDLYVNPTNPAPSVVLTSSGTTPMPFGTTVTFTATPSNAGPNPTYTWYKNSILIPGQTLNTYTGLAGSDFSNEDTISVVVTTSLRCSVADIVKVDLEIALGIADNTTDHSFYMYPNPNKGDFRLKGYVNTGNVLFEVLNTVGQVVYSENIIPVANFIDRQVRLQNINTGIYFVKLNAGGVTKTMRLLIQ